MKAWLKRNYYRLYYYKKKVRISKNVLLDTRNYFEGLNTIGKNCEIATCTIGLGTYINDNSVIKNALIGRFCSIGSNVRTSLGLHPSNTFVSTHRNCPVIASCANRCSVRPPTSCKPAALRARVVFPRLSDLSGNAERDVLRA